MTTNSNDQPPKRGRPATGQMESFKVGLPADVAAAVRAEAEAEFGDIAGVIRTRLIASYAAGNSTTAAAAEGKPQSRLAASRAGGAAIDIESKEFTLAQKRGDYIHRNDVAELYEKDVTIIRSRLLAIPRSLLNLEREQVAEVDEAIREAMSDIAGDKQETLDR